MKFGEMDEGTFEKYRLQKGDLLFNRTNSIDLVGKTSVFDLDGAYAFASYLIRLVPTSDTNPYFLLHFLNWTDSQKRLKGIATRAIGQANISASRLCAFIIAIPEKNVQDKVANILTQMDEKLLLLDKKKSKWESLFHLLLQALISQPLSVDSVTIPENA